MYYSGMEQKREKKYSYKLPGKVHENAFLVQLGNEKQMFLTTNVKSLEDSIVTFKTEKRDV
jgi:hypothetical protein